MGATNTSLFWRVWFQIGPFDKIRYDDQDMEPQKSSAIQMSVNHIRLWQEQLAMQKKEQESKARIDWIQKDVENRKRLRLMEENVNIRINFFVPPSS